MGMSNSQRYLVAASLATGAGDYFHCRQVGQTLGYSDAETNAALQSLDDRKLLILLVEGNARLLATGRALASRLETRTTKV